MLSWMISWSSLETSNVSICFPLNRKAPQLKINKGFFIIIIFYRNDCIEKKDSPEVFFCCCEGNMCNERFFYFPEMEVTQRKLS